MELVTTDKLDRLRSVCLEKVERIEALKQKHLENESIISDEKSSSLPTTALNNLKLKLAKTHVALAQQHETILEESTKKQRLEQCIEKLKMLVKDSNDQLEQMSQSIPQEKRSMSLFVSQVEVFVNQLQERHSMLAEEKRSWAMVSEEINCKDSKVDWFKKLISATQIQRQQAERTLSELEKEYFVLSNNEA